MRPILVAVDQELGEGTALRVAPRTLRSGRPARSREASGRGETRREPPRASPRNWRNPRGRKDRPRGFLSRPFSGEETEDGSAWTLNRFRQPDSMPR
jgi:hypothetical protein